MLAAMVCICMIDSTTSLPRPQQHIDRLNYGVHLFAINRFDLISETWQHTLVFTLPEHPEYTTEKPPPPHRLDDMLQTLHRMADAQTHQLEQTIADMSLIIPETARE